MFSSLVFDRVWEDFDVDRKALSICSNDTMVSITSGGCNVLNSVLEGPREVFSVDLNPVQNWLLELKVCAAQQLSYGEFWEFFGQGKSDRIPELYQAFLRKHLSEEGRQFWDNKIKIFTKGLYESGRLGLALKTLRRYLHFVCGNETIEQFFHCADLGEQREYYERNIWKRWWNPISMRVISTPYCLLPFGTHLRQARSLRHSCNMGFSQYLEMQIHHVLTTIPIQENYFWQQVFLGQYMSSENVPPYLKSINFHKLKNNVSRIQYRTSTVTDFLSQTNDRSINKFNLSDIMDWMSTREIVALWKQILRTSVANAVIMWRSLIPTFSLPPSLKEQLCFLEEEARQLLIQEKTGAYSQLFICIPCNGERKSYMSLRSLYQCTALDTVAR